MAVAVIDLRVQPFRLLTKAQAAHYCSLRGKKFDALSGAAYPDGKRRTPLGCAGPR
jgi:hypothetical protein